MVSGTAAPVAVGLGVGIAFIILFAVFLGSTIQSGSKKLETIITITGEVVCLPHRNLGGFQTTETSECAMGFLGNDGKHYVLNLGEKHQWLFSGSLINSDEEFKLSGVMAFGEDTRYDRYHYVGIMEVASALTVDGNISIHQVEYDYRDQILAILKEHEDRTGDRYTYGIDKCEGKPCILISLDKVSEVLRQIPRELEGYEVRIVIA